jgi:hypothetical protein
MTQPLPPYQQPAPYYPPPRTNGLGVAGFIVSLLGIFSVGLLSPIALFLSFIALFRRPRGFAFAGFILGLIGTLFIAAVFTVLGGSVWLLVRYGKPMVVTIQHAAVARQHIEVYAAGNGHAAPPDMLGQSLIAGDLDGWGRPLIYRRVNTLSYELRSAGSDGILNNDDDYEQMFDIGGQQ